MSDGSTYNLGRWGMSAPSWDDLDAETRAVLTQSLATAVEEIRVGLEPLIDSVRVAVLPVLDQVSDWLPSLVPTFEVFVEVTEFLRRWVPNWPRDVDIDKAWAITGAGIPLAFVPRPNIVNALVAAGGHGERLDILLASRDLILDDCRSALETDEENPLPQQLEMLPPHVLQAIDVLEAGHVAASCALGTSVVDSAIRRTWKKRFNYTMVRDDSVKKKLQEAIAQNEFRVALATRPLHSLLEEWRPDTPKPMPSMPSRHLVAHWADPAHMTEVNAVIIAMTATSLIMGLAERESVAALIARESA